MLLEIKFAGYLFEAGDHEIGFKFPGIEDLLGIAPHPGRPQAAGLGADHVKRIAGNQADHLSLRMYLVREIFVNRSIALTRTNLVPADNSAQTRADSSTL